MERELYAVLTFSCMANELQHFTVILEGFLRTPQCGTDRTTREWTFDWALARSLVEYVPICQ